MNRIERENARFSRTMTFGDDQVRHDLPPGESPEAGPRCAPIRRMLAGELDGLYRFASARLGHQAHQAEDVVQQTLLIAMAHASPPEETQVQRAWLRGIVRNVIRRHFRASRRRRAAIGRLALRRTGSTEDVAIDDGERVRLVRALAVAVAELDPGDQDLFDAFYRAGRSHAAIAEELGATAKSVEARLYRLRSRLRRILESHGVPLP